MKPALQAILIESNNHQMKINVMTGYKSISFREGHRDYHIGPVILCDELESWVVKANIYEVQHKILSQLTQEEWEADGFTSLEDTLNGLRVYYNDITMDSPVTVVRWNNVSGFWTKEKNIKTYAKDYGVKAIL